MKNYRDMTDTEVKEAVKAICRRCQRFATNKEANAEVIRLVREELGYSGIPAVTSTSTSSGPMTMRMFMVMMNGPSGNTISL